MQGNINDVDEMKKGIASNGFERITAHVEDHLILALIQAFRGRDLFIDLSDYEESMQCTYSTLNGVKDNFISPTNDECEISAKEKLIRA